MENTFTSPSEIPHFSELKSERETKINTLINNLKFADVETDEVFEEATERIKQAVLLKTATIGEPKYIDHKYQEKRISFTDQVAGLSKDHYYHEVSFPFAGSKDAACRVPEGGFSWSSSEHGLVLPKGNTIKVYIDLPQINPEKAKSAAKDLLSMTARFVESNNRSIESWNTVWESRIDTQIKNKREELIKIFGKK